MNFNQFNNWDMKELQNTILKVSERVRRADLKQSEAQFQKLVTDFKNKHSFLI